MIFQVLVSTTTTSLLAGLGRSTDRNIFVPSTEKQTWNGEGYSPTHDGSRTCVTRFHFRGSSAFTSNTATLLARRLFMITQWSPDGLKPASWAGLNTAGITTSQVSG